MENIVILYTHTTGQDWTSKLEILAIDHLVGHSDYILYIILLYVSSSSSGSANCIVRNRK